MSLTSHSEDRLFQIRPCTVTQLLPMPKCYLTAFPQITDASLFLRAISTVIFISVQPSIPTATG